MGLGALYNRDIWLEIWLEIWLGKVSLFTWALALQKK